MLVLLLVLIIAGCSDGGNKPEEHQPTVATSPVATPVSSGTASETATEKPKVNVQVEPKPTASAPPLKVTDISGHPAEKDIVKLLESGAVELPADGRFHPNESITRSQFIHWMYGSDTKGINPRKPQSATFSDVKPDHADFEMIEGLQTAGVITGFPDGTMKLEKELTREELCLLWGWYQRADSIIDPIIPVASAQLSMKKYSDHEKVGRIFIFAIDYYLTEIKLYESVFGQTPALNPQASVTRAEAAKWIAASAQAQQPDSGK